MKNPQLPVFGLFIIVLIFSFGCSASQQPRPAVSPTPTQSQYSPQNSDPVKNDTEISVLPIYVDNTTVLKAGNVAPNFALRDLNGSVTTLSDLRGKKVIITMWWLLCHGCTDEMPFIQEYFQKWLDPNVVLLAVNVYDTKENIVAFAAAKNLTFKILIDPDKIMSKAYVNTGVPTTFFLDKDGIVRGIKDGMFENPQEIFDMLNSY